MKIIFLLLAIPLFPQEIVVRLNNAVLENDELKIVFSIENTSSQDIFYDKLMTSSVAFDINKEGILTIYLRPSYILSYSNQSVPIDPIVDKIAVRAAHFAVPEFSLLPTGTTTFSYSVSGFNGILKFHNKTDLDMICGKIWLRLFTQQDVRDLPNEREHLLIYFPCARSKTTAFRRSALSRA
jgi:hypothetical protein